MKIKFRLNIIPALVISLCLCTGAFAGIGLQMGTGGTGDFTSDGLIPMVGDVQVNGNDVTGVNAIKFDLTPSDITIEEGKVQWDPEAGTICVGLPGGSLCLPIGQTINIPHRPKNVSGGVMPRGTVVYVCGGSGVSIIPEICLANATTEEMSSKTIGMTAEDIADNGRGHVIIFGLLIGTTAQPINTIGIVNGTVPWLSESDGEFIGTMPLSPAHAVSLGKVLRSHATEGVILVTVQNGFELGELHDVSNTLKLSPVEGELFYYRLSTLLWEQTAGVLYNPTLSQLNFRDSALGIWSQADGYMDIFADIALRVGDSAAGAPTNHMSFAPDGSISFTGTARIDQTEIVADNISLIAGTSASNFSDLQTRDSTAYHIDEVSGVPGIHLEIEFTSITAFQYVSILGAYDGLHYVSIQLYNFNTTTWETFSSMDSHVNISSWENYNFLVPIDTNYIGTVGDLGDVRVRFYHSSTGNPADHLELDLVGLLN